jgi:hypothetical protein
VGKTGVRSGMWSAACHKIERLASVLHQPSSTLLREKRENAARRRSIKRKVGQRRLPEEYQLRMLGIHSAAMWPLQAPKHGPKTTYFSFMAVRGLCACFRHGGPACWPLTNYQVTHRSSRSTSASATPILLLLAQPHQQGEHSHRASADAPRSKNQDVRLI